MRKNQTIQTIREYRQLGDSLPKAIKATARNVVPRIGWRLMDAGSAVHTFGNRIAGDPGYSSFTEAHSGGLELGRKSRFASS